MRPSSVRVPQRAARLTATVLTTLAAVALAGCTASAEPRSADGAGAAAVTAEPSPTAPPVQVETNLPAADRAVRVDTVVRVSARDGALEEVRVVGAEAGRLAGDLAPDGSSWSATGRLEPGTAYRVRAVARDSAGETTVVRETFRTQDLSLDEQTYPSIAPLDGETVGVGMPVIVTFDVPVTDRAAIERHLHVKSVPAQKGAWRWLSDREVHWRPKAYWKPGTRVTVNADVNSVHAGNGVFGQLSRSVAFDVGDALVMDVDVARHTMQVRRNGEVLRTIPVSAGKPGFETRSGTKVIIEKFRSKRMDAATTGISPGDPEYYNIEDVEYAMRVTYSGEFLHAAPWSVGSQGQANVSHGCVGMSTSDAGWLYAQVRRGDVVEVSGTDRSMTLENGYGDWNLPFAEYAAGSALS